MKLAGKWFELDPARVSHLDDRIADFDSRVGDRAIGLGGADEFAGLKGMDEKIEEAGDAGNDEVRGDIAIALGNRGVRFDHGSSLSSTNFMTILREGRDFVL